MAICVFCDALVQIAPILSNPVGGGLGALEYDVAIHEGACIPGNGPVVPGMLVMGKFEPVIIGEIVPGMTRGILDPVIIGCGVVPGMFTIGIFDPVIIGCGCGGKLGGRNPGN